MQYVTNRQKVCYKNMNLQVEHLSPETLGIRCVWGFGDFYIMEYSVCTGTMKYSRSRIQAYTNSQWLFTHTRYAPTLRIIFIILLMILCMEQNAMMWHSSLGHRVSIQQLKDFRVSWVQIVLLGMLHLYNSCPRASR